MTEATNDVTPGGSMLGLCGLLLRDPHAIVAHADDPQRFAAAVPRVLGIALGAAALFGAVVGSYRGGVQVGYAALKLPALLLVPLVVALPAVAALYRLGGAPIPAARLSLSGLVAVARTALIAVAMAPAVWLAYDSGLGYHAATVLLTAVLALAGLAGLPTVVAGLGPRSVQTRLAALGSVIVLALVTAQTGWVLRPFVARPRAEVTLLRPIEGDIFGSLLRAPLAAADVYLDYDPTRSPWRTRGEGGE